MADPSWDTLNKHVVLNVTTYTVPVQGLDSGISTIVITDNGDGTLSMTATVSAWRAANGWVSSPVAASQIEALFANIVLV